ncbi:MAG: hypothetical protein ACR2JH_05950 [Solirubrobacteraceae bacterium]
MGTGSAVTTTRTTTARPKPPPPHLTLLGNALASTGPSGFVPVVGWRGRTAAWLARGGSGAALLSFDQHLVGLRLHSGTIDAGVSGWRWGPEASGPERGRLVAAFNGAFKLSTQAGGFMSYGRVGAPLRDGLGSIVTYADGRTDIGTWHQEVPAAGAAVSAVRQNLTPLIDHGRPASSLDCRSCWGATLGGVPDPARSALGITAGGDLIWAGGEHLTVAQLADALLQARVVRAVELDINPQWVAGYVYRHRGRTATLAPLPVVPGQVGVAGEFLAPYSRDFFTIVAR